MQKKVVKNLDNAVVRAILDNTRERPASVPPA